MYPLLAETLRGKMSGQSRERRNEKGKTEEKTSSK